MSQKAEKPSLSGQRLKTRKRDEKEKYDPIVFRDAIIQGLNETGSDLEQVAKFLDSAGGRLNYRRYADVLFNVLFAGGHLAPGGSLIEEAEPDKPFQTDVCVFKTEESVDKLKDFYEVLYKLLRRYKFLERAFEEDLRKLLVFLKSFKEDERRKLAIITGLILANSLCSAKILDGLFEEHLAKEGLSLEFTSLMFKTWLNEKDISHLTSSLKKCQIEARLMELFPVNKRSQEKFTAYFKEAGLGAIAELQNRSATTEVKQEVRKELANMFKDEESAAEMVLYVKEEMEKNDFSDSDIIILIWNTLMAGIEWNKKEDLVAEQALKHLRNYVLLLKTMTQSDKSEQLLILRIQEYCYENIHFMKVFQKIIVLLYKTDVLSEETIVRWFKSNHSNKGKSVFLDQMKKFIEWLENAEEESEEED
ncbi:eIF5-mimic protein 2 [Patella vulgata]|uniref:eIF5-mimic protein 2 n=1 Tax=Patella vulgata TaxID=6465 RepID=UPI00217F3690|nr:eIF5-mimic protein 2 [Patella vulgata]